jgi:3-hydroxyanthranilate 3,4-dioxygenase
MILNTVQPDGSFVPIVIRQGDIYLNPGAAVTYIVNGLKCDILGNVPHNPVRFADTVGLVIERIRPADGVDQVRWYCASPDCRALIRTVSFHADGPDLGPLLREQLSVYAGDETLRTCPACGTLNEPVHANMVYPQ